MAKRLKAIPTPKEGFAIEVRKWSISAFPALWKDDLGAQNCGGGSNFYLPEVVRKVRFSGRQSVAKSSILMLPCLNLCFRSRRQPRDMRQHGRSANYFIRVTLSSLRTKLFQIERLSRISVDSALKS